jgi:hypothetical protein
MCLLAFYFAYANMLFIDPSNNSMILVYFTVLLSLSISYALSFSKKNNKLRYLPILGLAIALLFVNRTTGIIGAVIPYIYMLYIVIKDDYHVNYYRFKDLFINLFYAILPLLLIVFLVKNIELFNKVSLQYVMIFIISGLYLMRTSRHGQEIINNKKFMMMNAAVIITTTIASIVLSTDAILQVVIIAVKLAYSKILVPIVNGIIYVLFLPMALLFNRAAKYEEAPPAPFEIPENVEQEIERYMVEDPSERVFSIFAYIMAIALLAFLIYGLIKVFSVRKKRRFINYAEGVKEQRSFLDDEDKRNKNEKHLFNKSINQVRYWYKRFLMLCSKRKMSILENDSSNTIYIKSSNIFGNHVEDLNNMKEIYRKARYDKEDIDSYDVKTIKNIYKNLEKEKTEK